MEQLTIRLSADNALQLSRPGSSPTIAPGELARHAAGKSVRVLLPSTAVSLLEAQLPATQARRLQQALPYALEEQLAIDIENLHFAAASARPRDGRIAAAVVDKQTLRNWIAQLAAEGIHPNELLPDVLALPWEDAHWSLLLEDDVALLRTGLSSGLACKPDVLPQLLTQLLLHAENAQPRQLDIYYPNTTRQTETRHALLQLCSEHDLAVQQHATLDVLQLLSGTASKGAPINLLQGEFSRRERTLQLWQPWRAAAALLAALLILQGGMAYARYSRLHHESTQLDTQVQQIYLRAFPESQRIVNARVQMEQKLHALQQGEAATSGAAQLLLATAPLLHRPDIQLQALNYANERLTIDLTARDLQALDQLKQALGKAGMSAEIDRADSGNAGVSGRLVVRAD